MGGTLQFLAIIGSVVLVFTGVFTHEAHAYLDPGAGSYIFQVIIAFAIGSLYAVKLFWGKISVFIRNLFRKK